LGKSPTHSTKHETLFSQRSLPRLFQSTFIYQWVFYLLANLSCKKYLFYETGIFITNDNFHFQFFKGGDYINGFFVTNIYFLSSV